jgi:hypothetical protein
VRKGVSDAVRPSRKGDGSYEFKNAWRFLLSRA